tara:strand:- start:1001 stop:2152 length:1152 start_codon:yes stop_codon:yes gene_type:complete
MKAVYYWSPCLTKVGTYKSTINSAISLAKYSENQYSVKIINSCGEWDSQKELFKKNKIELINLGYNYFKFLPKTGFLKSRFSYSIIFILSFFPLIKLILKEKPHFLIIHLLTILPLFINFLKKNKTKIILRISGFPKLNLFRRIIWKVSSKNIYKITCPSEELKRQIILKRIFLESKIYFLPDPIIKMSEFKNKFKKDKDRESSKRKYFISVGRLTKQKNFDYLIEEFTKFTKINSDYDLYIYGDGENRIKLQNQIDKKKINDRIFLKGYSDKINLYMKNAESFILSSLWEDPGFVLIEAAMNNLFIISSNCKNGPSEFLNYGDGGILFESNKRNALLNSLKKFLDFRNSESYYSKIKITKKNCKKYTLLRHFNLLKFNILGF